MKRTLGFFVKDTSTMPLDVAVAYKTMTALQDQGIIKTTKIRSSNGYIVNVEFNIEGFGPGRRHTKLKFEDRNCLKISA